MSILRNSILQLENSQPPPRLCRALRAEIYRLFLHVSSKSYGSFRSLSVY